MFTCPHCNQEAKTLIMTGMGYVGCYACSGNVSSRFNTANYHNKAGLTGKSKNVTEIQKAHIWARGRAEDGGGVINKKTGKEWRW